jgi:hypothetical protein
MTTVDLINSAPQTLTVDAQVIADALDAARLRGGGDRLRQRVPVRGDAGMQQCVRDDLDCADLCEVTAKHLARLNRGDKQLTLSLLATCIEACVQCAGSCEPHAEHHEHCRLCLEACRRCETACQALLDALKAV